LHVATHMGFKAFLLGFLHEFVNGDIFAQQFGVIVLQSRFPLIGRYRSLAAEVGLRDGLGEALESACGTGIIFNLASLFVVIV
jgi:hypothetical protein